MPTNVVLNWVAPSAVAPGGPITGWNIYRQVQGATAGVLIAAKLPANQTTYQDPIAALAPGVTYAYSVTSLNAAGLESAPLAVGSTTIAANGGTPPTAPGSGNVSQV